MSDKEPRVLALDIGTSSARAVLYDGTGSAPTGGPVLQLSYPWRSTPDGGMETDADTLFDAVTRLLDAAVAMIREQGSGVAAVATAAFWHGLVGLDAGGAPATPLYAWGDTRAADVAARLRSVLDPAAIHRRTGCFLDASYPAARLLWLRDTHPDIFPRVRHWSSFAEYLGLRLFGELRCSYSMASGTGLLDGWRLEWDEPLLDAVGVAAGSLSPLVGIEPYAAPLRPEFATRWPELAGVPWLPALGDGACANLGSGAVGPERLAVTLGTTAALRVLVRGEAPLVVPELWCYRLDERRFVVGRALSNGGNVAAAVERMLRLPPPAEREEALAALAPDGHGLTVLPWLVGERGPPPQPGAGAAVIGQTAATTPVEVLRAWLEAVAYRIGGIAEVIGDAIGPVDEVVAGGGALNASPAWRQIIADVLGRPLTMAVAPETSARGAALVALEHLGHIGDACAVPVAPGPRVAPDAARNARYRRAAERQRRLAEAIGAA
jgi:gluconokinase